MLYCDTVEVTYANMISCLEHHSRSSLNLDKIIRHLPGTCPFAREKDATILAFLYNKQGISLIFFCNSQKITNNTRAKQC